jgi:hypothetical protein
MLNMRSTAIDCRMSETPDASDAFQQAYVTLGVEAKASNKLKVELWKPCLPLADRPCKNNASADRARTVGHGATRGS